VSAAADISVQPATVVEDMRKGLTGADPLSSHGHSPIGCGATIAPGNRNAHVKRCKVLFRLGYRDKTWFYEKPGIRWRIGGRCALISARKLLDIGADRTMAPESSDIIAP
jgi:hypothetical protein